VAKEYSKGELGGEKIKINKGVTMAKEYSKGELGDEKIKIVGRWNGNGI
jgi:hypothetical protein